LVAEHHILQLEDLVILLGDLGLEDVKLFDLFPEGFVEGPKLFQQASVPVAAHLIKLATQLLLLLAAFLIDIVLLHPQHFQVTLIAFDLAAAFSFDLLSSRYCF